MSLRKAPNVLSIVMIITAAVLTLVMYGILLGNLFNAFSEDLKGNDNSALHDKSTSLVFSNGLSMYKDIRIARTDQSAIE